MINIPTELLRTLVAVVDLRSFTKAAQSLGVTQPAVSAQIKRLQTLLDCELFDKSAPGVSLTASGELVVNYARRMLSINDQIVDLAAPRLAPRSLRIGIPGDFVALYLPRILADFRQQCPDTRISVRCDQFETMARDLRQGDLNLIVGLSDTGISLDARYQWSEQSVWLRSPSFLLDPDLPVPLITFGEVWPIHRVAAAALNRAGRSFEVVFVGPSKASVMEAVRNGLGVAPLARSRAEAPGVEIWEDGPLPVMADLYCGIYFGENGDQLQLEQLADAIFKAIGPKSDRHANRALRAEELAVTDL
jgi:DNA-binding transcriptional LysR family regulator